MLSSSRVILSNSLRGVGRLGAMVPKTSASLTRRAIPMAHLRTQATRFLSTENSKGNGEVEGAAAAEQAKSADNKVVRFDEDEYDDYEPKTAGQKVAFFGAIFARLLLLAAGGVCIFFTAKELFPGRMNPTSLFSDVFEYLQYNDDIMEMVGANMKAFGRDSGRNEGRRNHVDSYKYIAEDGSTRLRIRFHIKGERGQVRVWAEVSDRMKSDEYVYIIVQNLRNGRVTTIADKRDELEANLFSGSGDSSIASFFFKK